MPGNEPRTAIHKADFAGPLHSSRISGSSILAIIVSAALLTMCATRGPRGDGTLPPVAMLPVGTEAVIDASRRFADIFCSTLAAEDPAGATWGDCGLYLEPRGTAGPLPPLRGRHRVIVIPGVLARCIRDEVQTFSHALGRLESKGVPTDYIDVSGLGSTTYNARQIVEHLHARLREDPEVSFLLVGYSKGAPDAMAALVVDAEIREHTVALVTVAGTIGGSPIPDLVGKPMLRLVRQLAPDKCAKGDGDAFESLKHKPRLEFLRQNPAALVRTYSLVAVSASENTSRVHQGTWKQLDKFDADQDGQMLAHNAIAPGASYLGAALGDHWAVAMPFEHAGPHWQFLVNHNHFPREALLEAIVRFVVEDVHTSETSR